MGHCDRILISHVFCSAVADAALDFVGELEQCPVAKAPPSSPRGVDSSTGTSRYMISPRGLARAKHELSRAVARAASLSEEVRSSSSSSAGQAVAKRLEVSEPRGETWKHSSRARDLDAVAAPDMHAPSLSIATVEATLPLQEQETVVPATRRLRLLVCSWGRNFTGFGLRVGGGLTCHT